jgi:hypothetical protein
MYGLMLEPGSKGSECDDRSLTSTSIVSHLCVKSRFLLPHLIQALRPPRSTPQAQNVPFQRPTADQRDWAQAEIATKENGQGQSALPVSSFSSVSQC